MLLRNARRREQPVLVVHPRHPEVSLAAPSHSASSIRSSHSAGSIVVAEGAHPTTTPARDVNDPGQRVVAATLRVAHQQQEELLLLRQARPAAAAAAAAATAAAANPAVPPAAAAASASCAGGRPALAAQTCFCNVSTLYD